MQVSEDAERKSPLYDQVYGGIRDLILSGTLRPGESISEVKLALRLGVSRTPVREAVRRLVAENLMEAPSRGLLRVYAPTVADIAEVYFTRSVLEGAAAGLAAHFADEAFVSHLDALTVRMGAAVEGDRSQEAVDINGEFHRAIVDLSRNKRLIDILSGLEAVVVRYRRLSLMFPEHLQRSWVEHQEIVRLFREGDAASVEAYFRGHIMRAGARIVAAVIHLEGHDEPTDSGAAKYLLEMHRNAGPHTAAV